MGPFTHGSGHLIEVRALWRALHLKRIFVEALLLPASSLRTHPTLLDATPLKPLLREVCAEEGCVVARNVARNVSSITTFPPFASWTCSHGRNVASNEVERSRNASARLWAGADAS